MQTVPLRVGAGCTVARMLPVGTAWCVPGTGHAPPHLNQAAHFNQILTDFVAALDVTQGHQLQRRMPERPVRPAT